MNFSPTYGRSKSKATGPASGIALILVLTFLVLISVVVTAFFSAVKTELSGAKSYASGASSKQLAESAVQLSMGIIRQATTGTNASGNLAWASQPGMIRTYDASGTPTAYYKLYSSDKMVVTSFPFDPSGELDASWNRKPAQYTDLNAPVVSTSGTSYPIFDPSALSAVKGGSMTSLSSYESAQSISATNNNAPMPVKWIYILKNGLLTTPTSIDATGKTATWTGSGNIPTDSNPIVGRIAFWTDDDSCKININTAAGDVWSDTAPAAGQAGNPGSFWDIPRTYSPFEKTYFAQNQPAKNEFQRYPGHPATTYLSAAFPSLTAANIYQIAPRVAPGGSSGGANSITSASSITIDTDRLYSSVDELLFAASLTGTLRDANPVVSATTLKSAAFFLTAQSRAPEVNLFSQPRIVMWPVSSNTTAQYRTHYDSLFAYCGTLNGNPYYFQRGDSASTINDLPSWASTTGVGRNRGLITYLRNLTSRQIPGFGGSFLTKYPQDRDQILTEIFDYIRATNAQDPTFIGGHTFAISGTASNGITGQGQILPITDTKHDDSNTQTLRGFGRFPTVQEASLIFVGVGQTAVQTSGSIYKSIPPDASQSPLTAIADGKTRVQAAFLLNLFDPSQGYGTYMPNFKVRVSGLGNFAWNSTSMGDSTSMGFASPVTVPITKCYSGPIFGGYMGASTFAASSGTSLVSGYIDLSSTNANSTFAFTGGDAVVDILDSTGGTVLQSSTLNFPSTTFPVPQLAPLLKDPSLANYYTDFRSFARSASFSATGTCGRFNGAYYSGYGPAVTSRIFICNQDVVRSVVANTDYRLIAARTGIPSSFFSPAGDYYNSSLMRAHGIAECSNGGAAYPAVGCLYGKIVPDADYNQPDLATTVTFAVTGTTSDHLQLTVAAPSASQRAFPGPRVYGMNGSMCVPVNGVYTGTNATTTSGSLNYPPGDWDTGISYISDGPFINKADEGNTCTNSSGVPYYDNIASFQTAGSTFFSPNRQIPSSVMFGSLPTGVFSNRPWQTLLFHPAPTSTVGTHLGAQSPMDHLWLDLFNMPVAEPYAISDPFSTAGKINMNYQIIPFTFINRSTGVMAVLRPEQILVLSNTDSRNYKFATLFDSRRNFLDLDETLKGFQQRFDSNDIFRSASEICTLYLVPQGQTYANMPTFWASKLLTGDNVRERPYANIYPRLTTKSNTYTVHYRVQTLQKVKTTTSQANQWIEGKDVITSEYRGSSTVERYLDTGDTSIPDYATTNNATPIDVYYRFRILQTKQFSP
ncbi:MAG: Verru_Chthon cassette protein A [Chthoniobacteraceae bacterium]